MSIPTRIFLRELTVRPLEDMQAAYQVCTVHLRNVNDLSPQQRAWLIGARAMAGWFLGMPRTGAPIAAMMDGIVSSGRIAPADDWMQARRDVLAGVQVTGFNTGE